MATTQQLVDTIIEGIHEKKGRSVVTVNLQKIDTAPCAYFVIATGGSPQQVDAIVDSVEEMTGKRMNEKPAAIAGRLHNPSIQDVDSIFDVDTIIN